MKVLKYLLIIIAILFVGGWALVTTQSDSYDVKRTKLIKAPANVVFNNLNDFKNWEEWGPWMEEDSTIVTTYPENTIGEGGSYSWTSKDGPGNLKTIVVVENKSIDQKIQFNDYEPTDVYWTLDETEEGTNVTWGMKAEKTPFMFKLFAMISGGMDGMLGPMEEKGLENLETVIMEEMKNNPPISNSYRVGEITQKEIKHQNFIGYHQKAKFEEVPALFAEFMPKAGMHAANNNLKEGEFTAASVYIKWDEEKGETEFYIGLIVSKELAPAEGMDLIDIPAGNVITVSKFGNYGVGDLEAHTNIYKYSHANKIEFGELVWELYMNDPAEVKPEEIQTDIYYQVKN